MADKYDQSQIRVLKGLEAVRLRPGMYIGGVDSKALHHLIWEIVDNSIDEAMAGFATKVDVRLYPDGSVEVKDNGRGIPVDMHKGEKMSAATVAMTILHAGGKFGGSGSPYKTTGGLHGVGASVVNALSKKLFLVIERDGGIYAQEFAQGKFKEPLKQTGASKRHGTTIRFWPDDTIFETTTFDPDIIRARLQTSAFLTPGITLTFTDPEGHTFTYFNETFGEIIEFMAGDEYGTPISDRIDGHREVETDKGPVEVFVAMRWYTGADHLFAGYANGVSTPWGGSHEAGFRTALLRAVNHYGQSNNLLKESLTAEDVREGLVSAVAVRLHEPSFEGQTKEKLLNSEASGAANTVSYQALSTFFEENPSQAKAIVTRAQLAAKARLAAKAAREKVTRKDIFSVGTLPGKLTDCSSRHPEECELFIVEGDSAGGSAKGGRDPRTQAILPLRGKILNTQKSEDHKSLKSEQIDNIISALGCGVGAHFNEAKLRYHKIIFMTDADVDGAHISTLLLTLFNAHMPALIEKGYVYVAQPPLYRAKKGKQSHYIKDDAALTEFFQNQSREGWTIQRFKGLGEMDEMELSETTMHPESRILGRIMYSDGGKAATDPVFEMLMGSEVAPRRQFIEANAKFAEIDL